MGGETTAPVAEVEAILTAEIPIPHGYVFRAPGSHLTRLRKGLLAGHDAVRSPCLAFVVRHPTEGTILIDTGFHPDAGSALRQELGMPMSLLFRGLRPATTPFDGQLRERGIDPAAVRRVVMTHLHVDHTSGMRLLPNAQFVISSREWAAARGRFAAASGYVAKHLPPRERVQLVDPEREGRPLGPFRHAIDLLGDGTVQLLSTPGHTRGHLSVLVRRGAGADVLAAGDAAYTLRSIEERRLPMLTQDDAASLQSLEELREFTRQRPEAIVVPTHDPHAWRALAAAG